MERAFLGGEPFGLIARARTPVEIVMLGRNILTHLSSSLLPLRDALNATLRRRSVELNKVRPEVFELLRQASLKKLMDPPPTMRPAATTLYEVGRAFVASDRDYRRKLCPLAVEVRDILYKATPLEWARHGGQKAIAKLLQSDAAGP